MGKDHQVVVTIPVRNEEARLRSCLDALSTQTRRPDSILLFLNNCTDDSLEICQRSVQSLPNIKIVECYLDDNEASAGEARRRAYEHALTLAEDGVILTTDADTMVPKTWISDNLDEINGGADCVCGMAKISEEIDSARQPRLEFDDMRERMLASLQDEIASIVDPDPYDTWPRHQQHSGASIAVRAQVLRRAGGAPRVASGEDRALVAKLALFDARIRHAPQIQVTVSGRLQGRAAGGMAETIKRRLSRPDWLTDDALEPTIDAYRRVLTRCRLRAVAHGDAIANELALDLLIDKPTLNVALRQPYFGMSWDYIQRKSPVLRRRRVAFAELARETRQALALREELYNALTNHEPNQITEELRYVS